MVRTRRRLLQQYQHHHKKTWALTPSSTLRKVGNQAGCAFEEQERISNLVLCVVTPVTVPGVLGRRYGYVPDISKIEEVVGCMNFVQLYVDADIMAPKLPSSLYKKNIIVRSDVVIVLGRIGETHEGPRMPFLTPFGTQEL